MGSFHSYVNVYQRVLWTPGGFSMGFSPDAFPPHKKKPRKTPHLEVPDQSGNTRNFHISAIPLTQVRWEGRQQKCKKKRRILRSFFSDIWQHKCQQFVGFYVFLKWDLIGLVYAFFYHILTPNMIEIGNMSFNYWIPCFFLGVVSILRRIHDSFHQFVVLVTVDLSSGISRNSVLRQETSGKGHPQVEGPPSGWCPKLDSARLKWLPKIGVPKIIHNYSWFITPITTVYGTQITIVNGVYKPTYNWGAPHCRPFYYW